MAYRMSVHMCRNQPKMKSPKDRHHLMSLAPGLKILSRLAKLIRLEQCLLVSWKHFARRFSAPFVRLFEKDTSLKSAEHFVSLDVFYHFRVGLSDSRKLGCWRIQF